jgi:alkylhydroperoxidase family enzyme
MRLPAVKREDLSPDNQQRWDHIMAGRASGGGGPYSALIHAPILADHLATAENYYRKDAALAEADRELVILATAREFEAHYPWTRHEIRGRQAGLREAAIACPTRSSPWLLPSWARRNSSSWLRSSVITAPSVRWPTPLTCVRRRAAKLSE